MEDIINLSKILTNMVNAYNQAHQGGQQIISINVYQEGNRPTNIQVNAIDDDMEVVQEDDNWQRGQKDMNGVKVFAVKLVI